jgi:hypothetical protein
MTRPWKPRVAVRRLEAALRARGWWTWLVKHHRGLTVYARNDVHGFLSSPSGAYVATDAPLWVTIDTPTSWRELRDLLRMLRLARAA